jgi:hypothetical protein
VNQILRAMLALVVLMTLGSAAPLAHGEGAADIIIKGPTFRYSLTSGQDLDVCKHMLTVFNDKFAHLWDGPPLTSLTDDPDFSATSKYAFPLLPGYTHSAKSTAEMSLSAQPTSPEFSAIHWQEGSAHPGGCPAGNTCPGDKPQPILVAYLDFGNGGSIDTVIKSGIFFSSYNAMFMAQEYLQVWHGQKLIINGTPSLWDLAHPQDKEQWSGIVSGMYLRPFIYEGKTYIADYVPQFEEDHAAPGPPPYPIHEDMNIEQYHRADNKDATGRPEWIGETVCDLQMERLHN